MNNENYNETQLQQQQQQATTNSLRKKRESFSKVKSLTDINNRQALNENAENELVEIVEINNRYANQNNNNNSNINNNGNQNSSERYEANKKANLMLNSLKLNSNNNANSNSKFLLQLSQNNLIAIHSRESNNVSTNRLNHLSEQIENAAQQQQQQQQVVSNTSRNKTGKLLNRSTSRMSHVTRDPNDSYAYTNVQQYIEENDLMPPEKAESIRKWISKVNSCFEDWEKRVVEINIDSS
jgi:hypothetical protein